MGCGGGCYLGISRRPPGNQLHCPSVRASPAVAGRHGFVLVGLDERIWVGWAAESRVFYFLSFILSFSDKTSPVFLNQPVYVVGQEKFLLPNNTTDRRGPFVREC